MAKIRLNVTIISGMKKKKEQEKKEQERQRSRQTNGTVERDGGFFILYIAQFIFKIQITIRQNGRNINTQSLEISL